VIQKDCSILYGYISWILHGIWMIYITFERGIPNFQTLLLERSPSAKPCSSISWEQNSCYAAEEFLRVSEENVRGIQKNFERSPRKSSHRAIKELGIPQPTLWRVLRRRFLFNWVHLFESHFISPTNAQYQYLHSFTTLKP
jgi:hypothetical protein